eukprot:6190790-Pleurochrysis_carterae.AAC.1
MKTGSRNSHQDIKLIRNGGSVASRFVHLIHWRYFRKTTTKKQSENLRDKAYSTPHQVAVLRVSGIDEKLSELKVAIIEVNRSRVGSACPWHMATDNLALGFVLNVRFRLLLRSEALVSCASVYLRED